MLSNFSKSPQKILMTVSSSSLVVEFPLFSEGVRVLDKSRYDGLAERVRELVKELVEGETSG